MKIVLLALAALGLSSFPALADFEGTLEMKLNIAGPDANTVGGGTMNLSMAKAGSRMEMNMQAPMAVKMVMITRTDTPDKVFQINDNTRSYSETDVSKDEKAPNDNSDKDPWNLRKMGEDKILGYKTQHVLVTHKDETWELWTSKDLIDYATYRKLQASRGRMAGDERMVNALKGADADGMPLKAVVSQGGIKTTIELVKAEKKSLPASTFEIPAGYTKTAAGIPAMDEVKSDPRLDDAKKRMEEMIKRMPPDQREKFEQMMKQRQGANPSQP